MQTLTYSTRSRYTLTPTRDVGAFRAKLDKCNGKHKRLPIRGDSRTYPKFKPGDSTRDYVCAFEAVNDCAKLARVEWQTLNSAPCTLYSGEDAHQTLPDEFAAWEEFDAAQSAPTADNIERSAEPESEDADSMAEEDEDKVRRRAAPEPAPPGYALPAPLDTHSLPGPVADMVAECQGKVTGDPRPQFGLRLQAAKCRARAAGMRDGIANCAASPDILAAWAVNAPTNDAAADALDTLADAMPVPPAPTRAHVEHSFEAWRADPDGYRGHVIECYGAARAQIEAAGGYPYNADAWPLAAAMMAERYGYPDAREAGAPDGVARAFGSHCYSAGCVLAARRKRERERTAAARFIPGQIIGRVTWSDGKLCTGIILQSVSADGAECRLTGKRAGRGFEWTCDAYSLQCAIERAAERAGLLAEQRKRAKPAPVEPPATHTAPAADPGPATTLSDAAEHYSAGAARADAIGNHRRAEVLREIAAEESGADPVPTHSDPAPSADHLPGDSETAPSIAPDVFIRRATRAERYGDAAKQRAMRSIVPMAGHTVMFKPYGHKGAGFYWVLDRAREPLPADTGPAAPVARLGQAARIVQTLLDAMRRATPGIAPTAGALRSEAARVQRTGEEMRNGAPQYAADCRMAASGLRDLAEHAEAAREPDPVPGESADDDDDTAPAPLDGLDVADLGADGLAEFERAGGELPKPTAPAYSDAPRAAGPSLRIPATDPRTRIPARFAPVYCLRA